MSTTLDQLHREAARMLRDAEIAESSLDARLIVEDVTGTDRLARIANPSRVLEDSSVRQVRAALARRIAGEPVHRILGWREFHGLRLALSPETLEPRPDTETLVDAILPEVAGIARRAGTCRVLDLGTGTGAIALAILAACPQAVATATDLSDDALSTATRNSVTLGVADRFTSLRSDWFGTVTGHHDVIVSNPPYIATPTIRGLAREVRDHDPILALDGGPDGLEPYRRIAAGARQCLADGGVIGLEIGHDQKESVVAIFNVHGFTLHSAQSDLAGRNRALLFTP